MKISQLLFCFLIILNGCTQSEEIDIAPDEPIITVNSLFTHDSTWLVNITKGRNIVENFPGSYFEPVHNAVVHIRDASDLTSETLTYSSEVYNLSGYKSTSVPETGKTYHLSVEIDNKKILQAVNHIPVATPISRIEIDSSAFKSNGEEIRINIMFRDPGDTDNYYSIKLLRDAYYIQEEDTISFLEDVHYEPIDPAFDNDYSNGRTTVINDHLFNGKDYIFRVKTAPFFSTGTTKRIRIALLTVSKEYYEYFTTRNLQDNKREDPFSQPVQVFSNIENGNGIFAGFSSSFMQLE